MSCLRKREIGRYAELVKFLLYFGCIGIELQLQVHQLVKSKFFPQLLVANEYVKHSQTFLVELSKDVALSNNKAFVELLKDFANQGVLV